MCLYIAQPELLFQSRHKSYKPLIKLTQQRFKRNPSSKQNVKFKVLFGIKQVFDF
ncbi:hypothetical protein THOG11_100201 [Vibrio harveyi]|nr:hypothetical protein TH15OA1_110023 [Vibrio harveyi]CAH1524469.1 hypothetical protein VHARVF571_120023 [Vibrio harveyi]CAH1551019.1 hypothetical protein THOG11_100201 [Vibrio harveyi]CAH1584203.1 hypothetical protein THOD03_80200 [Vibrio harveyi]CAK6712905.1 hypothetical protein HORM4_150024 [Vibrio harveyi]